MARASRVCPTPGCPNLQPCTTHARSGPRQRGYDTSHDHLRRRWATRIATGQVRCWRCGDLIDPREPWDLGHKDDRSYGGPEHANRCNRSAAGRAAHQT